jgi:hypothetical protein
MPVAVCTSKEHIVTLEIFPYFGPLLSLLKRRKKYFKHLLLAAHFPVDCNLIQPWSSPVIYKYSSLDIHNYEYPNIASVNYNLRSLYCKLQCSFSECPLSCALILLDPVTLFRLGQINFSGMNLVWPVTNIPNVWRSVQRRAYISCQCSTRDRQIASLILRLKNNSWDAHRISYNKTN